MQMLVHARLTDARLTDGPCSTLTPLQDWGALAEDNFGNLHAGVHFQADACCTGTVKPLLRKAIDIQTASTLVQAPGGQHQCNKPQDMHQTVPQLTPENSSNLQTW